jgi:transcriptional/translational regulatory protein YebC/TACO1
LVTVLAEGVDEDKLTETIMDLGGDDLKREGEEYRVFGEPATLGRLTQGLKAAGYEPQKSELSWIPKNPITLDAEAAAKVLDVIDALEEHEDCNNWHANFEIPQSVIEQLEKAS